MDRGERWTRGVSVLGISGHINEYVPGVLVNNHVEERFGGDLSASGREWHGMGGSFAADSTQRRSYTPHGKTGSELLEAAQRHDQRLETQGLGADMLKRHGRFDHPQQSFYATMNQLTYGEDRQHGEPRVETYIWNAKMDPGSNTHNRTVPLNLKSTSLTATKRAQWNAEAGCNSFATTTRDGTMTAAVESALIHTKPGTMKPPTDGVGAMVGRKPVGVHADEVDKTYRRTGLRDVYYRGNIC